ncbi:MAG: hypothetical protein HQK99_10100 [Nitrospirae bacterium]|nr:hypothetical protein [Nitrospirota bacterium]
MPQTAEAAAAVESEQAHDAVKNDFAGGRLPSGDFGENAAWWWHITLTSS